MTTTTVHGPRGSWRGPGGATPVEKPFPVELDPGALVRPRG
ncbi:hypothetical protein [Actinacidiphila acididurans]|nr:hypothetical protein [Actinacidiphila acididurans]